MKHSHILLTTCCVAGTLSVCLHSCSFAASFSSKVDFKVTSRLQVISERANLDDTGRGSVYINGCCTTMLVLFYHEAPYAWTTSTNKSALQTSPADMTSCKADVLGASIHPEVDAKNILVSIASQQHCEQSWSRCGLHGWSTRSHMAQQTL